MSQETDDISRYAPHDWVADPRPLADCMTDFIDRHKRSYELYETTVKRVLNIPARSLHLLLTLDEYAGPVVRFAMCEIDRRRFTSRRGRRAGTLSKDETSKLSARFRSPEFRKRHRLLKNDPHHINAGRFLVKSPNGEEFTVSNLLQWCRQNYERFDNQRLVYVYQQLLTRKSFKGWEVTRLDQTDNS